MLKKTGKKTEKVERKRDPVSILLVLIMLAVAIAAGIPLLRDLMFSLHVRQENEGIRARYTAEEDGRQQVDFAALRKQNPDICAWITIDNTSIDFPVVQGSNNLEYLNKNAYGEAAVYGAIFLDTRNSSDFSDRFSLLYGHHMSDGNMFGDVDLFADRNFFQKNTSGTLLTPAGTYSLRTIAYLLVDREEDHIFCPEQWNERDLQELFAFTEKRSEQISSLSGGESRILALSSCSTEGDRLRSVLLLEVGDA